MDLVVVIIVLLLNFLGIVGCVLPILPGPLISVLSVLILKFGLQVSNVSTFTLVMVIIFGLAVTVLDYIVPGFAAKKSGSTKAGITWSTIGMLIGLFFFPPLGFLVGTIAGAIVGDLYAGRTIKEAYKGGIGAFLGFLVGTFIKLVFASVVFIYIISKTFSIVLDLF